MSQNDNSGLGLLLLIGAVALILILYFLSKLFFAIGIGLMVFGVIILFIGGFSQEGNFLLIGIVALFVGIILALIGHTGVSFFEDNPTGENLLDMSNTVVNVTKDGVKQYGEITNIEHNAKTNAINSIYGGK